MAAAKNRMTSAQKRAADRVVEKRESADEAVSPRKRSHDLRRWARAPRGTSEPGQLVVQTVKRLYESQASRRAAAARQLSSYLGREVNLARPQDLHGAMNDDRLPILQGIIDTAKAQIASVQRPKPVALTKGADYRMRLEAKKMTRFCEAQMWQPTGRYMNAWELGEQCCKDGAIWGVGVAKVVANEAAGQITIERRFAHDMYVGTRDSLYGSPSTFYEHYTYDRGNLADLYPKSADAIMTAAKPLGGTHTTRWTEDDDQVQVYEAFRLPAIVGAEGPAGMGRHIICVDSPHESASLLDDDWEHSIIPYAFFHWEPDSYGIWSSGIIQACERLKDDLNELLDYIIENTGLTAGGWLEFTEGDYDEDQLVSNAAVKLLKRKQGATGAPAQIVMPQSFNPAVIEAWNLIRSSIYDLTGVSDMATQGRQEQGLTAAVAIRTVNDLRTQRFLPKSRSYEQFFATIGKLSVMAAYHLHKLGKSPKMVLHREGYLDEIDFSNISLPLERCEIVVQSQSSTEDTMAGRRQAATDMMEAGWITPEQAKLILTDSNPDIPAFTRRDQAMQRYYQKIVEKFQAADPGKWVPARDFPMPDPVIDIKMGIIAMTDGYADTLADGIDTEDPPIFQLDLFRNWIVFGWKTLKMGTMSPLTYDEAMGIPAPTLPAESAGAPVPPQDPMAPAMPPPDIGGVPPGVPVQ